MEFPSSKYIIFWHELTSVHVFSVDNFWIEIFILLYTNRCPSSKTSEVTPAQGSIDNRLQAEDTYCFIPMHILDKHKYYVNEIFDRKWHIQSYYPIIHHSIWPLAAVRYATMTCQCVMVAITLFILYSLINKELLREKQAANNSTTLTTRLF